MDVAERLIKKGFEQKQGASPTTSPKNKVSFFSRVDVVLIPTSKEYHEAKIACNVWFQEDEYKLIKHEAFNEVRDFIKEQEHAGIMMTPREALHVLYQPDQPDNIQPVF